MLETFKCWNCGSPVPFETEPKERVYCEKCKPVVQENHRKLLAEYSQIRKKVMIDTALRKMEKAGMYMHEYLEISKSISDRFRDDEIKLLSSDEMIAAMVLESNGIQFETNKQIASYVVDFYIEDMKVVLEIDGDRHALRYAADSHRDIVVRQALGSEWEVVRIGASVMEKNPEMLPDAIEAVYKEKKKLRKENQGIIPEYFSKRERTHYAKLTPKKSVTIDRWDNKA